MIPSSRSVSQNQTKNKLQTFTISVGFQHADGKPKSNTTTEYQEVTLTHSQYSGFVLKACLLVLLNECEKRSLFVIC